MPAIGTVNSWTSTTTRPRLVVAGHGHQDFAVLLVPVIVRAVEVDDVGAVRQHRRVERRQRGARSTLCVGR